jgi:MSHA biogenesis protein MshJ
MRAKLKAWWGARSKREQWLAAVAAFGLVAATIELAALAPQRAAKVQLQREIVAARTHLDRLQATAAELAAQHKPADATTSLQARRERAQALIERAQVDLISPREMARQLAAILARHPQLRVVGMQSNPPQLVDGSAGTGAAALYEHGLRIDVEGRYLDLLAYLEALQQAPHRIFWRALDMKADGPLPVTRIELFTLSKESVWLRL